MACGILVENSEIIDILASSKLAFLKPTLLSFMSIGSRTTPHWTTPTQTIAPTQMILH